MISSSVNIKASLVVAEVVVAEAASAVKVELHRPCIRLAKMLYSQA